MEYTMKENLYDIVDKLCDIYIRFFVHLYYHKLPTGK